MLVCSFCCLLISDKLTSNHGIDGKRAVKLPVGISQTHLCLLRQVYHANSLSFLFPLYLVPFVRLLFCNLIRSMILPYYHEYNH